MAGVFGFAIGAVPAVLYWLNCGDVDWFDRIVFAELVILGVGYAQLALAASLLHDNILRANPFTVVASLFQIGWDYVLPCLTAGVAVISVAGVLYVILFRMPTMPAAAVVLWGFWVLALYLGMVVARLVGLTYHNHAGDLGWFQRRPRWGLREGRIYANS